jgi:hypothetical protein
MADPAAVEASLIQVPNSSFPGGHVNVFGNESINAAITQALQQPMAEGKTGAVTLHADLQDVKLVLAIKDHNWSVAAVAFYEFQSHDFGAGAQIEYSW